MLEIIRNYLSKEPYYIVIYSNFVYIYNYISIIKFTDDFISLDLEKLIVNIKGCNMLITKLEKKELLIKGDIYNVEKQYK